MTVTLTFLKFVIYSYSFYGKWNRGSGYRKEGYLNGVMKKQTYLYNSKERKAKEGTPSKESSSIFV